jgi:hypothetical protein
MTQIRTYIVTLFVKGEKKKVQTQITARSSSAAKDIVNHNYNVEKIISVRELT